MPIRTVKIRVANNNRCGKRQTEYETVPPPSLSRRKKRAHEDGEKKEGGVGGETRHCDGYLNDVYLQSFIITSAARFLTRSIIRRKYNGGARMDDGGKDIDSARVFLLFLSLLCSSLF